MNLIKITKSKGSQVVNARDLHQFLESKQDFSDWIKRRIEDYGFIENEDFVLLHKNMGQKGRGGHNRKDYAISLDMAKELSMVERNEKGRQARRYFILKEKELKALPTNKFQRTNKNAVSEKRTELLNVIRNLLRWGDMSKVAKELNIEMSYVKKVVINKKFNTEKADKITNALYKIALKNKNELLFGYQQMIDVLKK